MKSQQPQFPGQDGPALATFLNPGHPLYRLSGVIDWAWFEEEFGPLYATGQGRPALPTRLLVGLHYLKYLYNVSDEVVVASWVENPYWQYLCGCEAFQHELPCDPSSLVRWRRRVGAEGIEQLLKESLAVARRTGILKARELKRVIVDTTVQEKAIAFPTDARLYHKARRALVRLARQVGCPLRQSYVRLSKRALARQGRYAAAQQFKRAKRETRKLRRYLGCVLRNLERYAGPWRASQRRLLHLARRIFEQQRSDTGKVYSVHAPEVACIAKGKAQRRYEFGCKVQVVTTVHQPWIVGIDAVAGNPYDGTTLKPALAQVQTLTQVAPEEVFVDRGFRGQAHHPPDVTVYISGRRNLSQSLKKLLRRRAAIEPVIGHTKHDHGMARNHLLGTVGDRINAMLSGCAWNLRKLWRYFLDHPLPLPTT